MGGTWYVHSVWTHRVDQDLLVNRRFSTVEARAKRLPSSMAPSSSLFLRSHPPLHSPKSYRNQRLLLRRTRLSHNNVQWQQQMASLAEPRECEKKMSRWTPKHPPRRKNPKRRNRSLMKMRAILMQWISALVKSQSEALFNFTMRHDNISEAA
jgi:hypothetical protein